MEKKKREEVQKRSPHDLRRKVRVQVKKKGHVKGKRLAEERSMPAKKPEGGNPCQERRKVIVAIIGEKGRKISGWSRDQRRDGLQKRNFSVLLN